MLLGSYSENSMSRPKTKQAPRNRPRVRQRPFWDKTHECYFAVHRTVQVLLFCYRNLLLLNRLFKDFVWTLQVLFWKVSAYTTRLLVWICIWMWQFSCLWRLCISWLIIFSLMLSCLSRVTNHFNDFMWLLCMPTYMCVINLTVITGAHLNMLNVEQAYIYNYNLSL